VRNWVQLCEIENSNNNLETGNIEIPAYLMYGYFTICRELAEGFKLISGREIINESELSLIESEVLDSYSPELSFCTNIAQTIAYDEGYIAVTSVDVVKGCVSIGDKIECIICETGEAKEGIVTDLYKGHDEPAETIIQGDRGVAVYLDNANIDSMTKVYLCKRK
jgi:hypothetical protein